MPTRQVPELSRCHLATDPKRAGLGQVVMDRSQSAGKPGGTEGSPEVLAVQQGLGRVVVWFLKVLKLQQSCPATTSS